jgi:hypothetical protein
MIAHTVKQKPMRIAITLTALAVAAAHLVWPRLAIDGITALLMAVAIVPWLQPLLKSLELPGGLKIEFQDLESVAKRADQAGLLVSPVSGPKQPPYSFQVVAGTDPNLALAGLRIELERRLDALARAHGYDGPSRGIGSLLRDLNSRELINGAERGVLSDLAALLNAAVHGAQVNEAAAERALDLGPRILESLEQRAASGEVRYHGIVGPPGGVPAA